MRFIAETVHPAVRDPDAAAVLVESFNRDLAKDGWRLAEVRQMSGRPVYGPQQTGDRATVFDEPTGWPKVDRQLEQARATLDVAQHEEQFQSVGHLCREVLISVAQATYDPERHPSTDGVSPSNSDATRMIEAVFNVELAGGANEEARAHAKASLKLAVALQHKRTANLRDAALCAEATYSVVNILAVISGLRDR